MPTIAEILAGQEEEAATGTDLASIIATEREPSEPIGDPVVNRQAVADGHLTGTNPATAIDGLPVITDFEKQDPLFSESRRVGAAAVDNYLATLSPAERNAIPGSEHLDSDFPDFPGLEDVQAPFAPRGEEVTPTLGGRPEGTIPTRLKELGLTREFFANIPEMVKETFKQQAGGITLAAGEQLGQDLSWRSRLGRLAGAVVGPLAGGDVTEAVLPGRIRVAKELGDWATDAIAQGFGVDSALVEGGQKLRDEALTRIAELQPAEKTFMQEVITSGTQSAALALPGMAVSMITRNPTALLAAFGASTYGDSYGTARDAGKSPEESHRFALLNSGIEVGTEIGPAKILLGASKTAIRQTLTRLFKSEMGGETLATIGQKVNSAMSGVDTMPLDQWMGELWHELKVTWATTAILTPLQGATAKLAGKAVDRLGREDISGELEAITPEESAAIDQKAARAGKALKAAMFTTAGVAETDLDLSDEQIQKFIDQPELSDIAETDLDAIIGDEANEQRLISDLVDRVSGVEPVVGELPPGQKVIFHGTEEIFEEFDIDRSADGTIWFTDNKSKIEKGEVAATGKGQIMERLIDENDLNLGGWEESDQFSTQELIEQGFDGLKLEDADETTYQIFFPEKLQKTDVATPETEADFEQTQISDQDTQVDEIVTDVEQAVSDGKPIATQDMVVEEDVHDDIGFRSQSEIAADELERIQKEIISTGEEVDFSSTEFVNLIQAVTVDRVSGFKNAIQGSAKYDTVKRAQEFVEENPEYNAYYVEIDLKNLGGKNNAMGHQKANAVYRKIADTIKVRTNDIDGFVDHMRHGGDELALVVISKDTIEDLESTIIEAQIDVEEFALNTTVEGTDVSLMAIAHPKHPGDLTKRGIGFTIGIEGIEPDLDIDKDIVSAADTELEGRKKGFDNEYSEKVKKARFKRLGREDFSDLPETALGLEEKDPGRKGEAARVEPAAIGEELAPAQLEPFSPDQIESVPLREAVDSGLISEDEGAVIDGFLESLPESLRENFDVVFSGQEFEPTEAQLKAHDIKSAKGQVVRGALLERIKNEARDTIVMFGGSDITTFFHEFGELAYKRLLTKDERNYVAGLKNQAGSKVAPNEWFSDQLQSFVVQEKEEVFTPKLQKILSRIADTIRKIWERIRTTHRTPALDEIFRDILSGQRDIIQIDPLKPVDVNSLEFQRWFADSKVVDDAGEPLVVYHGTPSTEFESFDPSVESGADQEGPGFYFTNSEDEAFGYSSGTGRFGKEQKVGRVIPAYLRIQNPVSLTEAPQREDIEKIVLVASGRGSLEGIESWIEEDEDSFWESPFSNWSEDPTSAYHELIDAIMENETEHEAYQTVWFDAFGGDNAQYMSAMLNLGFDGVILLREDKHGGNDHYIAFRPSGIKSATTNIGGFSLSDPRITASVGAREIPEEVKDRFIDEDLAEQYGQAYRSQLNAVVAQSDIEDYQAIASEASKLAVERTDQHFKDQEKLIRSDAKKRAEEIAANEPVSTLMDEAISQGRIKLTDQIKADYGLTITEIINKRPGLFSKDGKVILDEFAIDDGGYESERDFVEAMANAPSKNELRTTLETNFTNEDLLFIDQYRDELWQEQFFIEESQAITELLEKKKPAIRKDLKGIIRQQTGQVRAEEKTVTETEALKAAFTKAAQAARAAERAGDKQGVAKEKARMKAILESAKERKQAQESRAKALDQIKKELKTTKVKKQAGKPRGKFTADIQEIFNTLRADLKLTKVEAFNKIAQNLEDHKDNTPPYSIAIENRLLSVIAAQGEGIGRLEFARIQQQGIENLLTEIKGLKGVGLSAREAQVSAKVTEITDTREKVIELVGGIPEGISAVGEEGVTLKGLAGIKQGIRNALIAGRTNSVVGWKDLLDIISFHDKTSKPGESAISKFGDVLDNNNAEKQGNINSMSAFREITFESYGLDNDSDMVKKFTQDAVIHDLGEFKTQNDVFVKLRMTRAEVRKRAMEIMDPTLHDTIFTAEGMGWTQDMADAVFDFLTPQDEDFITKQLEFYQKYYESINEVYKEIYGVNLPKNINYSPIAREGISQDIESTLGEFFNEISLRASAETAGGLKSRVASRLPLRRQSDISVIQQHVADMEHFKAWSEKIRDLNAVFGNSEVRQAIRVNFGADIDGQIQRFIIDMARGGTETSKRVATLNRMMGKYARSVLALKPSIFLKQLTSTIAYADSVPAAYWTKEVLKVHEIPKAVDIFFNEKTGSTLIKSRWEKGDIERDISNAMRSSEFARLRAKPSFLNAMMFNVKLGDMGAIIVGGYPVYKYHRSQGLSHEEALKRFESVTESTQQSADISQQSSWQRGGSFAKLFTMFMSSPNQYLRKEIGAIRNFAAGRITSTQFAKTMMIYHVILPMFFQLASDRFVWSGDEDEDALIPQISGEQKRAMILGSLNGFFIVGDALEAVISKALDLKVFGFENPMWSIVNDAIKAWPLLDWDDIDPEDFIIAIRGLAGATGAVTGLPGKQTVDFVTGFNETLSGEYETGVAQMMGWSPHQAERAAERSEE